MKMTELAAYCEQAQTDPHQAVHSFVAKFPSEAELLMEAALWPEEDVDLFERQKKAFLVKGKWGQFWLAPITYDRVLLPPVPRIDPRKLKDFAEAIVDLTNIQRKKGKK